MAFIRTKGAPPHGPYYQLVETYRAGDHGRQRVLLYLGQHATVEAYIAFHEQQRDRALASATDFRSGWMTLRGYAAPRPKWAAKAERRAAGYAARGEHARQLAGSVVPNDAAMRTHG